jgi:hypothetical protein
MKINFPYDMYRVDLAILKDDFYEERNRLQKIAASLPFSDDAPITQDNYFQKWQRGKRNKFFVDTDLLKEQQ